ncbi:MAG: hypothetical protein H0X37_16220 [Herpetosiphonaceae bacterium]|nr:hypothetical protein [Herpetosiphonaceae bacterium]
MAGGRGCRYALLGDRGTPAGQGAGRGEPDDPAVAQRPGQFPMINLLIAIAADQRQPDQVLYWYDRQPTARNLWSIVDEPLVADAIVDAYPERATAIWKKLAEAHIAQTQPSAYEIAVDYLRKLRDLFTRQGQIDEWRRYIAELRKANARKRKLMEMLDNLDHPGL